MILFRSGGKAAAAATAGLQTPLRVPMNQDAVAADEKTPMRLGRTHLDKQLDSVGMLAVCSTVDDRGGGGKFSPLVVIIAGH